MEIEEALHLFDQLDPDRKALLREIVFSGSPSAANEARVILEMQKHFPDTDLPHEPYDPQTSMIPY